MKAFLTRILAHSAFHNLLLPVFLLGLTHSGLTAAGLTPEQVVRRWELNDLQLSPDGTRVAFSVEAPIRGRGRNYDVWVYDLERSSLRQVTDWKGADSRPRWSPDGKTLAFLSNRSGTMRLYTVPAAGGAAHCLTESVSGVSSYAWSPNGGSIAFVAPEPGRKTDPLVVGKFGYGINLDLQFWLVDLAYGTVQQLTYGEKRYSNADSSHPPFVWGPGGDRLIICFTDDPRMHLFTSKIVALNLADGSLEELAAPRGAFGDMQVSPDGKTLAYRGAREDEPQPMDVYLLPVSGGPARNLTAADIDRQIKCYSWQKDGSLIVLAEDGLASGLYRCSQEGRCRRLPGFDVHVSSHYWKSQTFVARRDLMVFIGENAVRPNELWLSRVPGEAEQITRFNREWADIAVQPVESIKYASFDGTIIEAGLIRPAGFQPGQRYPLVVMPHGGPSACSFDRFEGRGHILASRGFAVLYPNVRGSTGYGHEFLIANRYDWGGADFKDLMAGVDYVIQQGLADPDRLGIGGWSYGGFMSAWAVTQTNRFKASVAGAAIMDQALLTGATDSWVMYYDMWYKGIAYEDPEHYRDRSPLTHVKNVTTPTLVLSNARDTDVVLAQGIQFHRALRYLGVETQLVVYPREPHSSRMNEEAHRVDVIRRFVGWLEEHLKE